MATEASRIEEVKNIMNSRTPQVSIIIPTYNESGNIIRLIEGIRNDLPDGLTPEIVVVDDNSPDRTGEAVEAYIQRAEEQQRNFTSTSGQLLQMEPLVVKIIHRSEKTGLISAVLDGIKSSAGEYIIVMDADFSHPPQLLRKMIDELRQESNPDIVIASRYVQGGSLNGWSFRRRLISKGAIKIAQYLLCIRGIKDPTSGFFAFKRHVIEQVKIDTGGYKLLIEMLVKAEGAKTKEIPYSFTNRKVGQSKLDTSVTLDYLRAVWHLYRYRQKVEQLPEKKKRPSKSLSFLSKAGKFYAVGATGLIVNYLVSYLLSNGVMSSLWLVKATLIGIIVSMTWNFLLNKTLTFKDRNFSPKHTLKQYGLFLTTCSVGAALQLGLVFGLVESGAQYGLSLILAVMISSLSNFMLNKKLTFKEKVWG
jgi:dolichol-phosphate mannosyltransferase